jgi:hypothetical protein
MIPLSTLSDAALLRYADYVLSLIQKYTCQACDLWEVRSQDSREAATTADFLSERYISWYDKIVEEQGRRGLPYTSKQKPVADNQHTIDIGITSGRWHQRRAQ